ncbi:NAD(P)-dependent oxidoreductase [Actinoplanes sp. CA-131856]
MTSGPVVVLGAAGRAGRAVTEEAGRRGLPVVPVVRDLRRHEGRTVAGNALDADSVTRAAAGAAAIVCAVTPFTAPPPSFDGFDVGFYEHVVDAMCAAAARTTASRIIMIGLFATLRTPDGRRVLDDPALFPEGLRPFAIAHARAIDHLRDSHAGADWLVLTPPPGLSLDAEVTGAYRLGDDMVTEPGWSIPLSYADLAQAVLDQISAPTRRREPVGVAGTRGPGRSGSPFRPV